MAIIDKLKFFYDKVKDQDIHWILSGSTSLVVQEVDVPINNDIDILTDREGSRKIDELLANYRVQSPAYSETEKYRSYFGIYDIDGTKIEVMGEFEYLLKDGSWSTPNQNNEVIVREYGGMHLPLLTLTQELREYENLARTEKVEKIKEVLYSQGRGVFEKIKNLLRSQSIEFKELHHEPTRTSEESAKARGEDLSVGGKGLVLKVNGSFMLFVLSAAKKLDSNAIEKFFNAKGIRFATAEELLQLTGLVPGSVPPFGKPILDLELYVDSSIVSNQRIAFNAGSLTDSIIMSVVDYLQIAQPQIFDFSKNN